MRVHRPASTSRTSSSGSAGAEPAGPLAPIELTFWNDGAQRYARVNRFVFDDADLVGKGGVPGEAFGWLERRGVSNPLWRSLNNRSDPALLRAQARFLELTTAKKLPDATRALRELMLAQVQLQLKDGLDAHELGCVPPAIAAGIVRRLAAAAGVDVDDVRVIVRPLTDHPVLDEGARVALATWETKAAARPFRPTALAEIVPVRTAAAQADYDDEQRLVKRMTAFFDANPRASLADFSREEEIIKKKGADGFWVMMDEMIRRADIAELAGPAGLGSMGGARPSHAVGVTRPVAPATAPSTPAPSVTSTPTVPTPKPSKPQTMTAFQILAHPEFADYLAAVRRGFGGGFDDWRKR